MVNSADSPQFRFLTFPTMRLAGISAISLDLDDTLWAFEPAVVRAEQVLHDWLLQQAPKSAPILSSPQVLRDLRVQFEAMRPELAGDMRALRLGSIRLVLDMSKEDPGLAEAAYDAF